MGEASGHGPSPVHLVRDQRLRSEGRPADPGPGHGGVRVEAAGRRHATQHAAAILVAGHGASFSQNIARSYNRLKAAYITFRPTKAKTAEAGIWTQSNQFTCHHGGSKMDLHSAPTYNFNRDSYRMQVSVGSVLYPSNPIRSCAEQYSQLVKAVGALPMAVAAGVDDP